MRRFWTPEESQLIRERYGQEPAAELARLVGRTPRAVWQHAKLLGVTKPAPPRIGPDRQQVIREMALDGYCNRCIGRRIKAERHEIGRWRRKLGVPPVGVNGAVKSCRSCQENVRSKTAEQCRQAGVSNLAEVRVLAFRKFAGSHGWPEDLRPRAVQMLELLFACGPMSRRQMAAGLGMPWKGSRKSLVSNDPEGSYLAHLQARGLVMRSHGRVMRGQTRGSSCWLYMLTPLAEGMKHGQHERQSTAGPDAHVGRQGLDDGLAASAV